MTTEPNFRHLIDSLNTGVIWVDTKLKIKHANPAAEMLLAISHIQAKGQPIHHYFRESDQTVEEMDEALQLGRHYTKRRVNWHLHNGQTVTVDYSVTPLPDEGGLTLEVNAMDRLIRISREEALIAAQETTRNLVRSMAHEIKNPLGGIRGAAQLLERELKDDSMEEFTQIIISEVDRLKNLVDRMLGPRKPLQFSLINIHEVLEHVSSIIQIEVGKRVQIWRDYDPSIPDFPGDKEQLIQATMNIVSNAVQALLESEEARPGPNCITLRTRIQRQFTIGGIFHSLVCRVDIMDNGPGIPEDIIEDIFYPMITGRAEGTGLGLAISQNLIHQHKGLIECSSQPGQTLFSLYLPLERHHAEA